MFYKKLKKLGTGVAVALVYFVCAKLGLRFAGASPSATAIWPGTGVALAAILLLGFDIWPWLLIGSFVTNLTTAGTVATSAAIAAGDTFEALLAAYMVVKFANGREVFHRVEDVFKFALFSGLGCLAAASIGTVSVQLGGFSRGASPASVALTWWVGDTVSAILLAPALMLWWDRKSLQQTTAHPLESAAAVVSLLGAGLVLFGGVLPASLHRVPMAFLCIPLVVWTAFRLRPHLAATAVIALGLVTAWGTLTGRNSFVLGNENESLLLLQAFLGVAAMTSLVLSAFMVEREKDEALRIRSEGRLELAQEAAQIGTWEWDPVANVNTLSPALHEMFGTSAGDPARVEKWSSRVHPEDGGKVRDEMEGGNRTGTMEFEYRYQHPVRGVRWFYCKGARLRADENRLFGVVLDVTQRKEAEEALLRAHRELERRVDERTEELKSAEMSLRTLTGRLLQMQDDERRRIARELHDSSGQVLAALNLNLSTLRSTAGALPAQGQRALQESLNCVEQLSKELRTMSYLLHPPLLDEMGLRSAVQWYAEGFSERSQIQVKVDVSRTLGRLSREMETAIFRIIQECLTNIHRHAKSQTANVSINCDAEAVVVEVRDEGKGMDSTGRPLSPGVGIQGMKERIRQLGGQLHIESSAGGTTVTALLPLGSEPDELGSAEGQAQPDVSNPTLI
jgi:PAS domain S-box-containing protein